MMWVIRFLLLLLLLVLIYQFIKFIGSPKRKLELARKQKRYFLYDDQDNVRKNFLLTYKGVMFEGEKYLGGTKDSFDVVSISIWPQQGTSLKGLVHEDFHYIEQKINETVSRCENRLEISSKGISSWYKFFANSFGLSWLNEREATQMG